MLPSVKYISYGQISGYANAAKEYVQALAESGAEINWETYSFGQKPLPKQETLFINSLNTYGKKALNCVSDCQNYLLHTLPEHLPYLAPVDKPFTAMTVWETNRLPKEWVELLRRPEKIIVPCQWNRQIFEEGGLTQPIHVIPHISEFEGSPPVSTSFTSIPDSDFVFLTVSEWVNRKNLPLLVEAYLDAFPTQKEVLLIIKTSKYNNNWSLGFSKYRYTPSSQSTLRWIRLKHRNKKARVMLIDENLPSDALRYLYARCNAYVSSSHAEGWGMGAYEAAWYGKPVIMTGYGGPLDFLLPDCAYLIDYQAGPVTYDWWEYKDLGDHRFAYPIKDHLVSLLQTVYEQPGAARDRGEKNQKWLREHMNKKVITRQLIAALSE